MRKHRLLFYIAKRIGLLLLTFLVIATVCFVLIKLLPLPAIKEQGRDAQLILQRREALGYGKPIYVQYVLYWKHVFRGDLGLGEQMYVGQEVTEIILSHTLVNPEWQMAPDSREGVRITFNLDGGVNNAWFQLRMSVHDPVMVLNAESDVPGGVKRVLTALYDLIKDTELLDLAPLKEAISEQNP